MSSDVPLIKLNDGNSIPAIGLGTWKSKPGEVTQAVKYAIDIGYRHIDGAYVYQNEKEVGQGIAEKIEEGVVKREDLYIVTKLWTTCHDPKNVEKYCQKSLDDLGLKYLDLYLMHFPDAFIEGDDFFPHDAKGAILFADIDYVDTWKAMENLVKKGLVKSIGVSNFNHLQIERIIKMCTIKPVTNQVECHPYLSQKKLGDWMTKHDVVLTAYSPLGSPDRPNPEPTDRDLLSDPVVGGIAVKYGKTPAQILLRYHIDRGFVVIPKSVKKHRMQENWDIFNFKISQEDMDTLLDLNNNERYFKRPILANGQYYPFHEEF